MNAPPAKPSTRDAPAGEASHRIDVIPYRIDVDELLTVQSFGVAVPILLVFVALDTERVHFLCLNDLIDKVLVPEQSDFATQRTKTIHIPVANALRQGDDSLTPLRFFAKRPKMYAAFAKFAYQRVTVARLVDSGRLEREFTIVLHRHSQGRRSNLQSDHLTAIATIRRFLRIVRTYDFWQTTDMWRPVAELFDLLVDVEQQLDRFIESGDPRAGTLDADPNAPVALTLSISTLWDLLVNLGRMYEELCRESSLPTYLGDLTNP